MDHSTLVPDAVLTDVSHFIGNVLSGEKLSEVASQKRENVLKRLTVFVSVPATNQYLDMNAGANKGLTPGFQLSGHQATIKNEYVGADNQVWEEEEYEECPAEMENFKIEQQALEMQTNVLKTPTISEDTVKMQRAALEIKNICTKSGPLLHKKRKYLIEQFLRCWGAIYEGSIYFYASATASKPNWVIDLEGCKARALLDLTKDVKKRDACFELVCPGKKSFQLVARTAKDMQQWVAIVCNEGKKCATLPTRRQLPSIPGDSDNEDEYDDVDSKRMPRVELEVTEEIYDDIKYTENSDDDSIYDDIGEICPKSVFNNKAKDETNTIQNEEKISKLFKNQEVAEEEDFYDDIDVFEYKVSSETVPLSDETLKVAKINEEKADSILNKTKEMELINEKTAEDEDIYDDVGVLMNREVSESNVSKQNFAADIPTKKEANNLPGQIAKNTPLKKFPNKDFDKNKIAHEINLKNQIGKRILKPVMLPKPVLKATTPSAAGTATSKNNIQNLIQQMETSLHKK